MSKVPDLDNMEEEVTFTGEELNYLEAILQNVKDESILPIWTASNEYTPFIQIRDKISESKDELMSKHREIRADRSCEEDGHEWGDTHYEEDSGFGEIVLKGCTFCPACQFKVVGEDSEWREVEEYRDLGVGK